MVENDPIGLSIEKFGNPGFGITTLHAYCTINSTLYIFINTNYQLYTQVHDFHTSIIVSSNKKQKGVLQKCTVMMG